MCGKVAGNADFWPVPRSTAGTSGKGANAAQRRSRVISVFLKDTPRLLQQLQLARIESAADPVVENKSDRTNLALYLIDTECPYLNRNNLLYGLRFHTGELDSSWAHLEQESWGFDIGYYRSR
jgi:hypothetical protein